MQQHGAPSKTFEGTAAQKTAMDGTTWVKMPYAQGEATTGFPRTSRSFAITCVSGTLAVSLDPEGVDEITLAAGKGCSFAVAIQGFHVRGVGATADYQAVATLV